ncbi:hypothetical protein OKW41_005101 [Paraburkholderia sp. UCT70]|uniref:hypothetical protein n=1 Tax=Paraburkholderia sp. UCT70 TaxID=2991068 RepID=UPI003D229E45
MGFPVRRAVTALIFAICGWSIIEAPFECSASSDDTWLLALVVAKLIIIAAGVAAIADVRFARGIFAFICGTSVLGIAPELPFEFKHSVAISLLSLIECTGKTAFVIVFCTGPMRERKLSVSCRPRCAVLAGARKQPRDSQG